MKNKIKTYVITGILLVFSFYVLPLNAADETITGDLTLSDTNPQLLFNDTSETGTDWSIIGNEFRFIVYNYDTGQWSLWFEDDADMQLSMHATLFRIRDQSSNTIASFHRDAPLSLDIQSDGDVSLAGGDVFIDTSTNFLGIGTTAPIDDLEIQSTSPSMYFDDTSADSTDWWVGNFLNDFVFKVQDNGTGGPSNTKIMTLDAQTGFVGIGTDTPNSPLHVQDNRAGYPQVFHVENLGSEFAGFRFTTTSGSIDFNKAGGNTFRLNIVDGDTWELQLDADGNLNIKGQIITAGSCSGGCDRVFAPDYELPTIEKHAAAMWSNRYLPEVGATEEGQPFNLSDKTERMLNELEKAHIYIEQLHTRNLSLEQRVIELEQQNQRIEELVMRMVMDQAEPVAMK